MFPHPVESVVAEGGFLANRDSDPMTLRIHQSIFVIFSGTGELINRSDTPSCAIDNLFGGNIWRLPPG